MRRSIICSILVAILLSACADNPVSSPSPIQEDKKKEEPTKRSEQKYSKGKGQIINYSPEAVPSDCPDSLLFESSRSKEELGSYLALQPWVHVVSLTQKEGDSIEIDFLALEEIKPNGDTIKVASIDYIGPTRIPTTNQGGLYGRYPQWYTNNSFKRDSASLISDGFLTIKVGNKGVHHFWMNSEGKYPRNQTSKYEIVCRLKISGEISAQLAMDFYKNVNSNWPDNIEAFRSNWLSSNNTLTKDSEGFVTVRVKMR